MQTVGLPISKNGWSKPVTRLAGRSIDASAVFGGVLLPGSISEKIAARYRKYVFGDATLQDLPDHPRFILNATNVQSAVLWRFSKPYMGDYRVGRVKDPETALADAVAASSAFPPVLSPAELDLDPAEFADQEGADLFDPRFQHEIVLSDGGVYDNLGLETAYKRCKTLIVSDGGGLISPNDDPARDWARHTIRVMEIIDSQVRSLRRRQLLHAFRSNERRGVYWSIRTPHQEVLGSRKAGRSGRIRGGACRDPYSTEASR